jgi:hypothetical protein
VRRYLELLRQPGVLRWSIVRVLTRFPILAAPISFILLSKTQLGTYGPGAWMSAADVIVEGIVAPLLGRRLDRYPMRREVQVALAVNALSLLAIAAGIRHLPVLALAALAGLAGGSIAGLIGGLRSQLTRMLPADSVHIALSWESVLADVIFTVGPALVAGLALSVDGRLPLVLMSAGSITAIILVARLPGIDDTIGEAGGPVLGRSRALLAAWPIYLVSAAAMVISAQIEIALTPLLQQSGQSIYWTGPLLSAFSVASVAGGLCYGLRGWPGSYRVQSLVLLAGVAVLFGVAAVTTADGVGYMAIPLLVTGFVQAGMITAQTLALHAVLPADLRSTGNSLMYTCGVSKVCMPCDLRRGPGQPDGIMIVHVPAPALSHFRPALRLADAARPVVAFQGCRVARAAARGRRTAARQSEAPTGLGRPRGPHRADPAPAGQAKSAPSRHPRHHPALAPPPDRQQMDLPAQDWTAAGQPRDRRAHQAARHREQRLGLQEDPR